MNYLLDLAQAAEKAAYLCISSFLKNDQQVLGEAKKYLKGSKVLR